MILSLSKMSRRLVTAELSLLAIAFSFAALTAGQEFSGCIPELGLSLTRLSSLKAGPWEGAGSMEVLDYDPFSKLAAIVEARRSPSSPLALLVVNYANPSAPVIHHRINVSTSAGEEDLVGTPNSVSIWNGFAALSLDGVPYTASGILRIYHMASGAKVGEVTMPSCSMPDSIRWTHDGRRIIVACEGEPVTQETAGSDPNVEPNPSGAIAIVYVSMSSYTPEGGSCPVSSFTLTPKLLGFQAYIDKLSDAAYKGLLAKGLRIDPRLTKATAAKDIEPEYVTLHSDSSVQTAFITLQENNAIATIDLTYGSEAIRSIWPLGLKDWSTTGFDPSDVDGIRIRAIPNVYAWYQPDTIVHAVINKRPYLFIANEGDSKAEARRVKDLALDSRSWNVTIARMDEELGRLNVDPLFGMKGGYDSSKAWNAQGPYRRLYAYGGRSWSILDATSGRVVFESGVILDNHVGRNFGLESLIRDHPLASLCFNCDRDRNDFDSRSDNAGPEPEALEVFTLNNRTYAAIGLERMGGFLLYDVSDPVLPVFGAYVYNRNFTAPKSTPTSALGDLAPEGIKFVAAKDSNNGEAFLLLSNEISATASAWQIQAC